MKAGVIIAVALLMLAILVSGCSSGQERTTQLPVTTPPRYVLPESSYMPEIPRVSVHEVKAIRDAGGSILIVDSRDREYYDEAHIEGAVLLPYDEMSAPYPQIDGYGEIVTYCT